MIDADLQQLAALLERTKSVLSVEDQKLIETLINSHMELTKLLRQRGTTIARLRRLFGLTGSEKLNNLFNNNTSTSGKPSASDDDKATGQATDDNKTKGGQGQPGQASGAPGEGAPDDNAAERPAGSESKSKADDDDKAPGHGRIPAAAYVNATHIPVPHAHLCHGDTCPACGRGKLYQLKDPSPVLRIVGQEPLAALCWDCERLRCALCGIIHTATPPPEAQGDKFSETAASMLAMLHYGAGMPFYRLERLQANLQTPVPSSTQWDVLYAGVERVRPVFDELFVRAASGSLMHADDTSMRILQFMGKRRAKLLERGELPDPDRTGMFTTAIVARTEGDRPVALFLTGRKHAGENLDALLEKRLAELAPPILMCDALSRNVPKHHPVTEANCNCHARRGVVDEATNFPDECRHLLEQFGVVFQNERTCKERGLSDQARLAFHQQHSAKVMADIKVWIDKQLDDKLIEPNSGMGKALNYILNHWDKLTAFLRIPGAPLENNRAERAIKRAIAHRKNSLFYRSQRGAEVGDIYMTLIYTAELHEVNPSHYLDALMTHDTAVAEDPAAWLPWNYLDALARLTAKSETAQPHRRDDAQSPSPPHSRPPRTSIFDPPPTRRPPASPAPALPP